MYRYVRNKDRDAHRHCYPKLFYPEMYVINGGYKAFYEACQVRFPIIYTTIILYYYT